MSDNQFVIKDFTLGEGNYVFTDALVMEKSDYDALTVDEINALKQKRYDDWYAIVTAPPKEPDEILQEQPQDSIDG